MNEPDDSPAPDRDDAHGRVVRPYTLTGGRTRPDVELPYEATMVATGEDFTRLPAAAHRVLEVCDRRSVAEVSALVDLPIAVVRVLVGDLAGAGLVRVQATLTEDATQDERIALIERTLRGLRDY